MLKKILLVDDVTDEREYLKLLLELSDYEVIEAVNGKDAINAVKQFHPDLVLMDIAMPIMSGLLATKIIRTSKESAKLPIIAVTGYRDDYRKEAIEAGCENLIDKPIDFQNRISSQSIY